MRKSLRLILAVSILILPVAAAAAPTVPEAMRAQIQDVMRQHVTQNLVDGTYVVYDTLNGGFKHLKLRQVHPDVRMVGGFYVSCLDFVDADGTPYDIDLLVAKAGAGFHVYQDLIHAVAGQQRAYHNER